MKIDFCKKDFVWVGFFIILISIGIGVALNSGDYQVMGHSSDELAPPVGCLANEALIWNGVAWTCGTPAAGTSNVVLGSFGAWDDVTTEAKSGSQQGPISTNGILVIGSAGESAGINIYTGSTSGSLFRVTHENSHGAVSLGTPVKSGDYWRVSGGTIDKAYWMPIETSALPMEDPGNCVWTGYATCTAWQTSNQLICPSGKFNAGYQRQGCTGSGCDDSTRCEQARLYCCDIVQIGKCKS